MPTQFDVLLKNIDQAILETLVQPTFGVRGIITWKYEKFRGGIMGGVGDLSAGLAGVARFFGTGLPHSGANLTAGLSGPAGPAGVATSSVPWSMILKVLPPSVDGLDPQEATREWFAYQSGRLPLGVPGQLSAPRLYGVLAKPEPVQGLWLEEVVLDTPIWGPEHYKPGGAAAWPVQRQRREQFE